MKTKECTYCGKSDHSSLMCFNKPRSNKPPNPDTKGYRNEKAAYAHWYRENPPDENGLWYCHYCGEPLTNDRDKLDLGIQRITIDHYKSRSGNPHLRYEPSNFVPSCYTCNSEKGSLDGDTYIKQRKRRVEKDGLQLY